MDPIRIKAFRNKYKKSDKHPDFKGKYKGHEVAVWKERDNEGDWCLSISLKDAEERGESPQRSDATGYHQSDDEDLPF